MPFVSINFTNPRTNPWKFNEKILRIGEAGKWDFLRRQFWIFFLLHLSEKSSPFIWGIIFFCTMDHFFRILEKKLSELLCTRLYTNMYYFATPWYDYFRLKYSGMYNSTFFSKVSAILTFFIRKLRQYVFCCLGPTLKNCKKREWFDSQSF